MALLLDIFGFLSVVLRGLVLTTQSLMIGGIAFLAVIVGPVSAKLGARGPAALARARRLLIWSALGLAAVELAATTLECIVLAGTVDIPLAQAFGAGFARFELVAAAAALLAAWVARRPLSRMRVAVLFALAFVTLAAQVATSHAAAQLDNRGVLLVAEFLHIAAAGVWIGGIPYFLMILNATDSGVGHGVIGRRFSLMLIATVTVLIGAGLVMALAYVGSLDAIYGTAYGVMVVTKVLLLLSLLFLGAMNNRIVERLRRDPTTPVLRLRRFAELEIGIGLTVLFAAASLTSQPPAVDLTTDRLTGHEIVERLTPHWPRLTSPDHASLALSELQARIATAEATNAPHPRAYVPGEGIPPPRNAADMAWSEYNHNVAGLFMLVIGLLAFAERTGKVPWARHWPLLLVGLSGFLLIKSDPQTWPLGNLGLLAGLRDPEVVQHHIFALLVGVFGVFEWRVRTGRVADPRVALVFPGLILTTGALLFTHTHALANIKDQLLMEMSHVPLALFGMTAGAARWLELRLDGRDSRIASWVWPIAFMMVGLILLGYRES